MFTVLTDVYMSNTRCDANIAAKRGGAMYCLGGQNFFANATIWTANSAQSGGALYADNCAPNLVGSNFTANSALTGGALASTAGSSPQVFGSLFENNVAQQRGGALSCVACTGLLVSNAQFIGNSASLGGGAMAVSQTVTMAQITQSRFIGNVAVTAAGGAISLDTSLLNVDGSLFNGNVGTSGGSMQLSCFNDGACNVTQSTFVGNVALAGGGGAVVWDQSPPAVLGGGNTYTNNTAVYGRFVASCASSLFGLLVLTLCLCSPAQAEHAVVVQCDT